MTESNCKVSNSVQDIKNPLELGLMTLDDIFESNEKRLKDLTFISTVSIS